MSFTFLKAPKGIVIHHSATRDTETLSYDAIRRHHVWSSKFFDIGYHYVIELIGSEVQVLTGRGLQYMGAHTRGHNACIGICVVGNYSKTEPTKDHMKALFCLLHSLLILYPSLSVEDVKFHNEVGGTECPGTNFPSIESIRKRLTLAQG